jgi:hypothetical protein
MLCGVFEDTLRATNLSDRTDPGNDVGRQEDLIANSSGQRKQHCLQEVAQQRR